jgi:hypothetical protein
MAGVQSIGRAFAILRALAVRPAGITDLSFRKLAPFSSYKSLQGEAML